MKKISVCAFLVLAIFLTTCKKYPDGPAFSLRSAKARIAHSVWAVEYYEVNNIDSTSFFLLKPHIDSCENSFQFYAGSDYTSISGCTFGDWGLMDNNKIISINASKNFDPSPFVKSGSLKWNILRLTIKEFWIETDYSGNHYKVKLKAIKQI